MTDEEKIVLTDDERERFVAYLRQQAEQEDRLAEFLSPLPEGTVGDSIRRGCSERGEVMRSIAREMELLRH